MDKSAGARLRHLRGFARYSISCMEPYAFTLILIAAVAHATWNSVAKSARGNSISFVWAYLVIATLGFLPITIGFIREQSFPLAPWILLIPLISGILHTIYLITLQTAYSKGDLSVVYPIARGTGPLLTMIIALTFIGERPKPIALLGALVIMAGILFVTASSAGLKSSARHGILWGALTGVAISTYTLWDNRAVAAWDLKPVPFFALALTVQTLVLTPYALRNRGFEIRTNWWRILVVAILWPLAYILVLTAQQTTPISIVAPVREISIVFGAFIGWIIFKEERPARRIIGAAIVVIGVALLTR